MIDEDGADVDDYDNANDDYDIDDDDHDGKRY